MDHLQQLLEVVETPGIDLCLSVSVSVLVVLCRVVRSCCEVTNDN